MALPRHKEEENGAFALTGRLRHGRDIVITRQKRLLFGQTDIPCALGPTGVTANKQEGDGATPAGRWPLRYCLYRADRIAAPKAAGLPVMPISPRDGWCDDPSHPAYNRPVTFPLDARAERLWRGDRLYDLIVVIGFNDAPVVPGNGSAIFLHVARPNYAPTEGCIAIARLDLIDLLAQLRRDTHILIEG